MSLASSQYEYVITVNTIVEGWRPPTRAALSWLNLRLSARARSSPNAASRCVSIWSHWRAEGVKEKGIALGVVSWAVERFGETVDDVTVKRRVRWDFAKKEKEMFTYSFPYDHHVILSEFQLFDTNKLWAFFFLLMFFFLIFLRCVFGESLRFN